MGSSYTGSQGGNEGIEAAALILDYFVVSVLILPKDAIL